VRDGKKSSFSWGVSADPPEEEKKAALAVVLK
jgi:hypothetical protein